MPPPNPPTTEQQKIELMNRTDMDYLLQSGQAHRDAVWQAVDPERRLVHSFSP
jgi:hypothetical protein